MQIKIFCFYGEDGILGLESQVNEFIKDRNVINLMQSESMGEDTYNLTITVVYD